MVRSSQPIWIRRLQWGLLWLVGGLLLALAVQWLRNPVLNASRLQKLPQHPLIQVYMNQNQAAAYTDPYRHIQRPGDNLEQIIVDRIRQAKSRLEVAVQELRSPLIAQALRDRAQAGVRVRLILENTYSRPWSSFSAVEVQQLDQRMQGRYRENFRLIDRNDDHQLSSAEINTNDALEVIRQAGIPWLDDTADASKGSGLMHHKFVVVDGQEVIVTSANFTMSDLHGDFAPRQSLGNANSLVAIQSPAIAALFTEEFNILWGDGPGGQTNSRFGVNKPFRPVQSVSVGDAIVQVKFSPTPPDVPWEFSSNGLIAKTLAQSRKQAYLALFVFSDQHIANTLETVAQKGSSIRALIEPTFAFQYYSEALDLLGVTLPARTHKPSESSEESVPTESQSAPPKGCGEAENHPWSHPIQTVGVPKLPPGDLLHHKFGLVDQDTVIMGSHNWTEAADHQNDETLLVMRHPTIAAHYAREYDRLWANSRLGLPDKIRDAAKTIPQSCFVPPLPQGASGDQATDPDLKVNLSLKINLNTATREELEQLPGVGPKLAQRIIEIRQQKPFQSLQDLDQVPGVGAKLLEQMSDRVTW